MGEEETGLRASQADSRGTTTGASDTVDPFRLPPIQIYQSGGIWRVTKDGLFYGDFHAEQDALKAAEVAGRDAGLHV